MPAGMQKVDGQLPGPPAFRSALIASQTFSYSGVSGGWPASGIQLFGLPGGRTHCPLRSGYLLRSAWAAAGVASSAAAKANAEIEPARRMKPPPLRSADRNARGAPSALVVWGRKIHPPPVAMEADDTRRRCGRPRWAGAP